MLQMELEESHDQIQQLQNELKGPHACRTGRQAPHHHTIADLQQECQVLVAKLSNPVHTTPRAALVTGGESSAPVTPRRSVVSVIIVESVTFVTCLQPSQGSDRSPGSTSVHATPGANHAMSLVQEVLGRLSVSMMMLLRHFPHYYGHQGLETRLTSCRATMRSPVPSRSAPDKK